MKFRVTWDEVYSCSRTVEAASIEEAKEIVRGEEMDGVAEPDNKEFSEYKDWGAVKVITLEEKYNEAKKRYEEKYGPDSWQWRDEGSYFAVGDYLSSFEMTGDDWLFVEREGIKGILDALKEEEQS